MALALQAFLAQSWGRWVGDSDLRLTAQPPGWKQTLEATLLGTSRPYSTVDGPEHPSGPLSTSQDPGAGQTRPLARGQASKGPGLAVCAHLVPGEGRGECTLARWSGAQGGQALQLAHLPKSHTQTHSLSPRTCTHLQTTHPIHAHIHSLSEQYTWAWNSNTERHVGTLEAQRDAEGSPPPQPQA